ncbi:hypothetical protein BD311DRAFT_713167 [Dichomitus squalens]|uniref:Pentacotripeptide-repeat region of PRORP domain-containing protein n=1 Tax=Dichomitus squalens TaxID=114155 RepID=A0A4Q9MYC7_9APHY|nr:hypothetical protein BD311DRAFT_713167 [Dichomitus squalens]
MFEPLAVTVLTSILPARPLATQLLSNKSAFGMAVRTASISLSTDFFTPRQRSADGKGKGKGRAMPEDEYVACASVLLGKLPRHCIAVMDGAALPMARLSSPRPRIRRSSSHKNTALGSRSHIPSLRTWTRQVDVVQRRHASSRTPTAAEPIRHPTPSPEKQRASLKIFSDIASGARNFSAEDAWRAFQFVCDAQGRPPGNTASGLAFVASIARSVASGAQGPMSAESLRLWGERIEGMLHHIDPNRTSQDVLRIRWNILLISGAALQGKLDEAVEDARVVFNRRDVGDEEQQQVLRSYVLELYTVIVEALRHHRGPTAVFEFLTANPDLLLQYLAERPPQTRPDQDLAQVAKLFTSRALDSLATIEDPAQFLQDHLSVWSKDRLSAAGSLLVRAISLAGRSQVVHDLLLVLRRHAVTLPHSVILSVVQDLTKNEKYDQASALLATVTPSPSDVTVFVSFHTTAMILTAHQGDVRRCEEHYHMLDKRGFVRQDHRASLMHAYAKAGQPTRVVELFNQFFPDPPTTKSSSPRPNLVHYTTVILAFSQVGDLNGVNTWVQKLSQQGLRPDLHVYSIILQSFAMHGDIDSMSSLLDQMRSSGVQVTVHMYTTLIATLAKRNDPMGAERLYKHAVSEGVVPDRVMISAIMNAHVEAGSWEGAIRAFDYLKSSGKAGEGVTIEVFNTLMKAYVLIGAPFRLVANLFRQLDRAKLRPDSRTFALLIQSACDNGFMDIAEDLYREMERLAQTMPHASLKANVYVLTIMMNGYLRMGKRIKARGIFELMKSLSINANAITYAAILKAYGEQKTSQGMQVAEEFLESLLSSESENNWLQTTGGRRLTLDTVYRPLMNAYAQRQQPADVERLHSAMANAGQKPTLGTTTLLLDAYRRSGDVEAVEALWPRAFRLGIEFMKQNALLSPMTGKPSDNAYGTLLCVPLSIVIDAFSAAGKHREVAQAWKALKDQGLQFDSHNWNHLVIALVRAGEPVRAFDVVENVILRYQRQSRHQATRERDTNPASPLLLDLPPPEEGDLPPPPPEAPLHSPARRTGAAEKLTRRLRHQGGSLEEKGTEDFAHPLHLLHTMSPVWNLWRPHGATLVLLGRVLDHLKSGRLVQAVRPGVDTDFEQAAVDAEEIRRRTEAAGRLLGEVHDQFPETVQLVREYDIMRQTAGRTNQADDGS